MIKKITSNDLSDVKSPNYALIFSASWCVSCHDLIEHIEPLSGTKEGKLFNVDVDKNGDIAERYNIKSLPTILIFRNGEMVQSLGNNHRFNDIMQEIMTL